MMQTIEKARQILIGIGLVIGMLLAVAPVFSVRCLDQLGPPQTIGAVEQGSLLLHTGMPDSYIEAPVLSTDVTITVRGVIARVRVTQTFSNPSDEWTEGIYVFPLPAAAAVDTLRMVIGERIIEGQIKEREEARKIYEQARSEGRKASLVEQERPNIFTTSVANIGPDEQIDVVIEYQEVLQPDKGELTLRFPMVVGPRFIPGGVADAERITPPVALGEREEILNPVSLKVDLDAGLPLQRLICPYQAVKTLRDHGTGYTITLDRTVVPADRDFVLRWTPELNRDSQIALFTEELDGETYALLMVMPPAPQYATEVRLPREMILVIDTSGSMHGASIDQARQALLFALDQMHPDDMFNVIQFNDQASALFDESRQAFPVNLEAARRFVSGLDANGGTNMLPALELALADKPGSSRHVRQVVFITDGCVGNEEALFGFIEHNLGRSRLFTVGIGSAPNSFFMERSARFGRGTFTYIGHTSEVADTMSTLFSKLESPVLSDLEVRWHDPAAEMWPERLPDLYAGEPVVVSARLAVLGDRIEISGRRGQEPWQVELTTAVNSQRTGVDRLWARSKIADLMDQQARGADADQIRAEVVAVALKHHLVSRYTSLVAVDVTPSRDPDQELKSHHMATNLPHGWSAEHVFGNLPQGGTAATLYTMIGIALLALAALLMAAARVR
jgi:Ca-activated chloride channel family protein